VKRELLENVKKVEEIGDGIVVVQGEESPEYITSDEIRKVNYLERKSAKRVSERVVRMLEGLDEAIAITDGVPERVFGIRDEVRLLLGARGGRRTTQAIYYQCHSLLSEAIAEVQRVERGFGRIRDRKVAYKVVGEEYERPHPSPSDIVGDYKRLSGLVEKEKDSKEVEKK